MYVITPRKGFGTPAILPPDVIFGSKLQFWFRAGSWTLSGSDILTLDNLEGTAARDATAFSNVTPASPGATPPQATTADGVDAISFQGTTSGGYFQWDGQMAAFTSGQMFIVHKTAADPQAALANTGLHHIFDSVGANRSHYNLHTTGNIFESFGFDSTATQVDTGNPVWDLTLQHLYTARINSSGNLSTFYNGNNSHYSDATARTVDFANATMKWGRTNGGGGVNYRWAGTGFELIGLNTLATAAEANLYLIYAAAQFPGLPVLATF